MTSRLGIGCCVRVAALEPLRYDDLMSFADTVVLFVLALLLFGPKKLPIIARQIGKALNEFKRASNEFKAQIESEINQLEFQEQEKKQLEEREKEPPVGKILPPVAPPADSVESSRIASQPEGNESHDNSAAAEPVPTSHQINSAAASNTTNV